MEDGRRARRRDGRDRAARASVATSWTVSSTSPIADGRGSPPHLRRHADPPVAASASRRIAASASKRRHLRHAEQARDGVEEAARAGADRRRSRARLRGARPAATGDRWERRSTRRSIAAAPRPAHRPPRGRRPPCATPRGAGVPPRLAHRRDMPRAAVRTLVADQELATPDGLVGTQADAVEGDTEHRAAQTVLGEHARDVSVVVLHAHLAGARLPPPPRRGASTRSRDAGLRPRVGRLRAEEMQVGAQRLVVVARAYSGLSRSPMCGPVNALPSLRTQNVFLRWAPSASTLSLALRRRGPGADTDPRARRTTRVDAVDHSNHGVVVSRVDVAIVEEKPVGDVAEALHGLVVVPRDRLFADIAAGHHQRPPHCAQEQVVHRRVRQHHAELLQTRAPQPARSMHRSPARRPRGAARSDGSIPRGAPPPHR